MMYLFLRSGAYDRNDVERHLSDAAAMIEQHSVWKPRFESLLT